MSSAPARANTTSTTASEAVADLDPNSTAVLLAERISAWKCVVSYLEEYVEAMEKIHRAQAKEYERALKVISQPLKHGENWDQSLGGVAGFFENMRANTQALITTNAETEKSLKGSVLPVLERLHKEIKNKGKELTHGAAKGQKEIERTRNATQKQIEMLGQQTAAFESTGGKMHGSDDPYVVHRGVLHRLHKQVIEENNHRNDLLAVQSNFESFEKHVLEVVQQAMEALTQLCGNQGDRVRMLHSDMLSTVQKIPADFEWKGFMGRSGDRLVNPADPPKAVESTTFPNMEHASTKPLIEGSLERKSRNKFSWGYQVGYYVVTPSKFLHEFKDSDNARHDPKPELSIYLPDAVIGAPNVDKFNIKGKDQSKTVSSKLTGSSELAFKAHTAADAERWFEIIKNVAGATGPAVLTSPTSPTGPANPFPPISPTAASEAAKNESPVSPATPATPVSPVTPAAADTKAPAPAVAGHEEQETGISGDDQLAEMNEAKDIPVSEKAKAKEEA